MNYNDDEPFDMAIHMVSGQRPFDSCLAATIVNAPKRTTFSVAALAIACKQNPHVVQFDAVAMTYTIKDQIQGDEVIYKVLGVNISGDGVIDVERVD